MLEAQREQKWNQAQTYPQFLLKTLSSNRVKAHSTTAYRSMAKNWSIRINHAVVRFIIRIRPNMKSLQPKAICTASIFLACREAVDIAALLRAKRQPVIN